jgi:uncharacterized protein
MKPSEALRAHRAELREIVTRHGALHPRVFGSAIHRSDTEESDLDLLVDPTPRTTLMTLAAIQPVSMSCLAMSVTRSRTTSDAPRFRAR